MSHVHQRKSELDKMLEECKAFDQLYAQFEQWLSQTEGELDSLESQRENSDAIAKHEVRKIPFLVRIDCFVLEVILSYAYCIMR